MIIEAVCLHKIIIKILINEATNFGKVTVSLPFTVITWFMVTAQQHIMINPVPFPINTVRSNLSDS